ncbi:MAG: amidase [Kiloniellales bacterium]
MALDDPLGAFAPEGQFRIAGAVEGALAGLAFAAKDIYDVAGHVTGCGSPDWRRSHAPATATAAAVAALIDAGASLVGKTMTDEIAYSLQGENAHYGTPVNPAAPDRVPGGSSSGSASAVAGGLVDFALGSDTGGSVRAPSSYCGLYGIRPTHGRISLANVMPLAPSFDTAGWFTREAGLLARVGAVLLGDGGAAPSPPRRLLMAEDGFALADDGVAEALAPALRRAEAAVAPAEPVTVAPDGLATWFGYFRILQAAEVWQSHGDWVRRVEPDFGPGVRDRFAFAATVSADAVAEADAGRRAVAARLDAMLGPDTVLCLPTAPGIAPLKDSPPERVDEFRERVLSLTCIAGLCRLPQVSLPLATVQGCPVGFSLIARRGGDEMLLALTRTIADAAPQI